MYLKLFLVLLMTLVINNLPVKALAPTDATSEKYLIDHGHSPEIVRMINLQKERIEGNSGVRSESQNKFKKFLKNLWFEQDMTMPLTDFGYNKVTTVETDKSKVIPAVENSIKNIKNKMKKESKKEDYNEVKINDIKVREVK